MVKKEKTIWRQQNKKISNKINNIIEGFSYSFRTDNSSIKAFIMTIIMSILNIIFLPSLFSKLVLLILASLLFIFEMFNTIVETIVDRISINFNPISKGIKDMAACAVFTYQCIFTLVFIILIIYSYLNYRKWKENNKDKKFKDYILFTFTQ